MRSSAENGAPLGRAEPPPRTEAELLEREERRAHAELRLAAEDLGDELMDATGLRERVSAHPWLSTTLGALGGFLLARPVASVGRRVGLGGLLGTLVALANHGVKQVVLRQASPGLLGALADPRVRRALFR